jgi:EpsI family protein
MMGRRDLLIGAGCLLGAGAAYGLKPRRDVSVLGSRELNAIVPREFGAWTSQDVGGLIAPKIEGSLADRLYNEMVERVYVNSDTQAQVMVLMAHGQRNTDALQLHRPESCYPAFGFTLAANKATEIPLASGVTIPARRLVAEAPGRRESIVYWSRLGEYLPVNSGEQRRDRLRTAMGGYIPDGLLARFSAIGSDAVSVLDMLEDFVPEMIAATPAADRDALIGTQRAKALIQA